MHVRRLIGGRTHSKINNVDLHHDITYMQQDLTRRAAPKEGEGTPPLKFMHRRIPRSIVHSRAMLGLIPHSVVARAIHFLNVSKKALLALMHCLNSSKEILR